MLGWTYKCVYCWFQHAVFMTKIDGETFIMSLDFWPPTVTHKMDKNKVSSPTIAKNEWQE